MDFEDRIINVLGTDYKICFEDEKTNESLDSCNGYCDSSVKKIVIAKLKPEKGSLEDLVAYTKKVIRHELIHAFMYESGLDSNVEHKSIGVEETFVDWIAIQAPKLIAAFKETKCL